ncbi:MAG TPA: V-type ATP synthase subunit D [Candidatus Nanoarchaeia archaeon]|nr:V-type ATP synthase subunit D [Candidatus Nanoarchaeia archaeon]
MADVKPTRSELIKLKQKIKLAKSGYNLLKRKRDGLILEFFKILKNAKTVRQELTERYKDAVEKINSARMSDGDARIRSISMAISRQPSISLTKQNIMGVVVPKIEGESVQKSMAERGYSPHGSSAAIDEAAKSFEEVIEKTIRAAEIETSMKRLLQEIEKTKRRVNALEFAVIPKLQATERFIKLRLEEMERENTFRLKRIKG